MLEDESVLRKLHHAGFATPLTYSSIGSLASVAQPSQLDTQQIGQFSSDSAFSQGNSVRNSVSATRQFGLANSTKVVQPQQLSQDNLVIQGSSAQPYKATQSSRQFNHPKQLIFLTT